MSKKVTSLLVLLALLALTGCKSTKVIGSTVYQRLSFPSGFGSYQHLIVVYPVGQTNLQQVIATDSVPGPIPAMFNASVKSAAFVWGMHELRDVGRSSDNNSVDVSNRSSTRNNVSTSQTVNAPGSHPNKPIHQGTRKW